MSRTPGETRVLSQEEPSRPLFPLVSPERGPLRRYAEFVVRARIPLAIVVTAILAIAATTAPSIELDFTVFSLVDASDDAKAAIDEFYEYPPPDASTPSS